MAKKENPANSGLLALFLNESFRAIAVSFLTIFSSIFIYKTVTDSGQNEKTALIAVALYFFGLYFFKLISHILAEEFSLKTGLKNSLLLGQIFLILCIIFLFLTKQNFIFLILSSITFGLATGFYWTGYHGLLAKLGNPDHFGKQIGLAGVLRNLLLLLVPLIGGFLISVFNYSGLFIGAIVFILIGFWLARPIENAKTHIDTSIMEIFELFKTQKKAFWGHFGQSFAATIYGTIFPLYLFFIFGKELSLGGFFTLSMVLSAIISFLVGKWIDKKGFGHSLIFGSLISSMAWIGRGLTKNASLLLSLNVVDQLTAPMIGIPIDVLTYEKAIDGKATGRAVLFREAALTLGAIFACLLVLVLVLVDLKFEYSFFAAAIFSLFSILLITERTGRPSSEAPGGQLIYRNRY